MRTATLTSKGQLTVPIEIRHRLGLKEGDRIAFISQGGDIVLRLDRGEKNPFAQFAGALPEISGGVEAINAWVAELRDES